MLLPLRTCGEMGTSKTCSSFGGRPPDTLRYAESTERTPTKPTNSKMPAGTANSPTGVTESASARMDAAAGNPRIRQRKPLKAAAGPAINDKKGW